MNFKEKNLKEFDEVQENNQRLIDEYKEEMNSTVADSMKEHYQNYMNFTEDFVKWMNSHKDEIIPRWIESDEKGHSWVQKHYEFDEFRKERGMN